jgi:hypothetical protein
VRQVSLSASAEISCEPVIKNDPIPRQIAAVWVLVIKNDPIRGATPALWVLVITNARALPAQCCARVRRIQGQVIKAQTAAATANATSRYQGQSPSRSSSEAPPGLPFR